MEKELKSRISEIISDKRINALFLCGSYVNGYYKKDSDIDIVAVSDFEISDKPISYLPNLSIHYVHSSRIKFFDVGRNYASLKIVPLYNLEECVKISETIKSELVRRELIRFRKNGKINFATLDPLNNFLLKYAVERPWRIKPIKRIFNSQEAKKILSDEYKTILNILIKRKMVTGAGEDSYKINDDYLFDEKFGPAQIREGFNFKFKNSYGGWHYMINIPTMIKFSMISI
jgi:predicted nucleotidyltransferase